MISAAAQVRCKQYSQSWRTATILGTVGFIHFLSSPQTALKVSRKREQNNIWTPFQTPDILFSVMVM
jgi:hypothetical protein